MVSGIGEGIRLNNKRRGTTSGVNRIEDLNLFYELLHKLESKIGMRYLAQCDGKTGWPRQGVYFFFEDGEIRDPSGSLRVVRVGTHAVSDGSKTRLWDRLRQHRGNLAGHHAGGGKHRGSIFRLHVGASLINKNGIQCTTWLEDSTADKSIRDSEHSLEVMVSNKIRTMPFLWLKAEDNPGHQSVRKYIERNAIGLLSNYSRPVIDEASPGWLGRYCANALVRESGMWNVDHVDEKYCPVFLSCIESLI